MPRAKVKICGITRIEDALFAEQQGADFLGFIFYQGSPRYLAPEQAKTIIRRLSTAKPIGVFVDSSQEEILATAAALKLWGVQFYNNIERVSESHGVKLIKSLRVQALPVSNVLSSAQHGQAPIEALLREAEKCADYVLLDAHHQTAMGGMGQKFDWTCLPKDLRQVFLAGGINAENVPEAIKLQPFALDLSSSVELAPGIKDHVKLREFFNALN